MSRFWGSIGVSFPDNANVRDLHAYGPLSVVAAATSSTFVLLFCWNIWKHRNAVAFREQDPSLPLLNKACRDEARLWRVRLPAQRKDDTDAWLVCLGEPVPV